MSQTSVIITNLIGKLDELAKQYIGLAKLLDEQFQALSNLQANQVYGVLDRIESAILQLHQKKQAYAIYFQRVAPHCQRTRELLAKLPIQEGTLLNKHLLILQKLVLECKEKSIRNNALMQQHHQQFQKYYNPSENADIYVP